MDKPKFRQPSRSKQDSVRQKILSWDLGIQNSISFVYRNEAHQVPQAAQEVDGFLYDSINILQTSRP